MSSCRFKNIFLVSMKKKMSANKNVWSITNEKSWIRLVYSFIILACSVNQNILVNQYESIHPIILRVVCTTLLHRWIGVSSLLWRVWILLVLLLRRWILIASLLLWRIASLLGSILTILLRITTLWRISLLRILRLKNNKKLQNYKFKYFF